MSGTEPTAAEINDLAQIVFTRRNRDGRGRSRTWADLPEIGRRNYRQMVTDVLAAARVARGTGEPQ